MAFRYSGSGWRVAGSVRVFGDQIMTIRGHTDSYPVDGTLGDTAHSNRTSDHNPDSAGVVRALDFFEHEAGFVDAVAEALRLGRDPRLKYFIHDRRMFASYQSIYGPPWEWREYTGDAGHRDHGHLSVVATNIADGTAPWQLGAHMFSDHEVRELKQMVRQLDANNSNGSAMGFMVRLLRRERDLPLHKPEASGTTIASVLADIRRRLA
jgi:hypothetical protein